MHDEIKWLIGVIVAIGGMIAAAWRVLSDRQHNGDAQLHARVNRIRDEFVRKSDLDGHLSRIDTNVHDMREEYREAQRETNRRLDAIITAVSKGKPS